MTATGKIARLPQEIRDELNRRLRDGERGRRLVDWLNSLPETQRMLAEIKRFKRIGSGSPISRALLRKRRRKTRRNP